MAEVLHGGAGANQISVTANKTQAYGLAGNDTLTSTGKSDVILIGGTGDDVLSITGGNGTLSGGKGKDTFNLYYSTAQKISAVIEDIDPDNDKIVIAYEGTTPQLDSVISGEDVIWTDSDGYFNLTLKGSTDASDYYDGEGNDYLWEVLKLTNQERENENLSPLTMSDGLIDSSSIRAEEIVDLFSHTRPDSTDWYTAIEKSYNSMGENIAAGQNSPASVVTAWMNSEGHRANILNGNFKKLGVGYLYDSSGQYKYYWAQMFAKDLKSPDTISTDNILKTTIEFKADSDTTAGGDSGEKESISLKINGEIFNVTLEDNDAARALKKILPLELNMNELNGNEKYFYLENNLPTDSVSVGQIYAGDLMLYGADCIVLFYKDFSTSYSYTRLGTLDNPDDLAEILGSGNVNVAFAESADDFIDDNETDTLIIYDGNGSAVTLGSVFRNVDASARKTKIKITGNTLDNSIIGGNGNDVLDGAAGDNTLNGGKGNDTLRGGIGADVFIYENKSGKDVINSYGAGDVISLGSGAAIKDAYMTGRNAVIKFNSSLITVKNISNAEITLAQDGAETIFSNGALINGDSAKVFKSFKGTINLSDGVNIADASLANKKVTVNGSAADDSITGGKKNDKLYGYAGNDTIIGGAGNDSLWGGDGADTFIYAKGDGKDVIYGFDDDDTLTFGNLELTGVTLNSRGTEIYLKVGSTKKAVTLKDFDATNFNINGEIYNIIVNNRFAKQISAV